jgi:hypothetical protein
MTEPMGNTVRLALTVGDSGSILASGPYVKLEAVGTVEDLEALGINRIIELAVAFGNQQLLKAATPAPTGPRRARSGPIQVPPAALDVTPGAVTRERRARSAPSFSGGVIVAGAESERVAEGLTPLPPVEGDREDGGPNPGAKPV